MFTILGATGFIGGALAVALRQDGHEVYTPAKGDPAVFKRDLGDVIYAIGIRVAVDDQAPTFVFPEISIERARREFGLAPRSLLADLPDLVAEVRKVVRNA